jgi:acetoin utilization deacetylase AcuC-like enzyme
VRRRLFYCDHLTIPLPPGHKFPTEKYALLRATLAADGFYDLIPAPFADAADIELAHDPAYVRGILEGTVDPRIMRRIALGEALSGGFGGNLAGGTHHAFRSEGAGFCVFNDLAIAIFALRGRGLRRAAVIDLDVHQGDGTASIFEHDADVLTISLHGENNFPFRKQKSRIDVGLPDGTADEAYLSHVSGVLPAVREFRPEVILYQSGVDGLAGDLLGRLNLSLDGLKERDRMVLAFTRSLGIPTVVTLGGGYASPIARTAEAHANTYRVAAEVYP